MADSAASARRAGVQRRITTAFTQRVPLKATAVLLAIILWFVVNAKEPQLELVPVRFTPVLDSAERAGARRVFLVEEPMAAAIGAGLPVTEPTASMIVDIGGGTTEVAIISLADISVSESVRTAGDDFDDAIVGHMKKTYNMAIGEQMAERIKIEIGSAAPWGDGVDEPSMDVKGRDLISGLPRKTLVTAEEIRQALQEPVTNIVEAVKRTLERAEPELAADLVDNGITMAGGSSLLRGLTTVISHATGLDTRLAEDPLTCVARGTAVYLENLELWKDTMESDADDV